MKEREREEAIAIERYSLAGETNSHRDAFVYLRASDEVISIHSKSNLHNASTLIEKEVLGRAWRRCGLP